MTEGFALYAISCSRGLSGCQRCNDEHATCTYSRSKETRATRKRKRNRLDDDWPSTDTISRVSAPSEVNGSNGLQSHLATDIEVTREQLRGVDASQHNSLGALSSLSEACAAVWHDAAELGKTGKKFFLFEDRAAAWTDAFIAALDRGRPLFSAAPVEVLDHLRASRPHLVHDRAWLVIYYSIVLSLVSSTDPTNASIKAKLRCNLWLALNDVRLLLEPSDLNIHALTLLACHVEEFTTPSLCWMLLTNACRMLQALGVTSRRFDSATRERRLMTFWHLNLADKGIALIFGRPPTFHRAMAKEIALPTVDQLLPFKPHVPSAAAGPVTFGAHYIHRLMLLSRLMAEIWSHLYDDVVPNESGVESATEELESWYQQTQTLLEAAALVEKPFLKPSSAASIDLGLCMVTFQYHYLTILLARSSNRKKGRCIDSSKRMLHLLHNMVSDSEEPFNGIVWQLLCCPFTPFLTLFGEILSNGQAASAENIEALVAMEQLPIYLEKMSLRNSLAAKLERIAVVFVQHARSVVQSEVSNTGDAAPGSSIPIEALPDSWLSNGSMLDWDSLFDNSMTGPALSQPQMGEGEVQLDDLTSWTNDFFGSAVVDWIG